MKVIMMIVTEDGEPLVSHGMELTKNFKLKFMPSGKSIKDAIKAKLKGTGNEPK